MVNSPDAISGFEMLKNRSDLTQLIPPAFFLVVSAIVFWQTNTDLVEKDIASGSMQYNAAFVPEVLATVLAILSVVQVVQILRRSGPGSVDVDEPSPDDVPFEKHLAVRGIFALIFIAAYILAVRPLGYHIATPLLMAGLFALLNVRNLFLLIGLSVGLSFMSAFVFGRLLNVVLPTGVFEIAPF